MKNEKWRAIQGFEGLYEVSSLGRVRSLTRHKVMKQWTNHGYSYVSLQNGKAKSGHRVHRLVAAAFIPNPEGKQTVNHLNGNKQDNRVSNLEWATYSENELHSIRVLGKRDKKASLTDDQVRAIRSSGKKAAELAREYGTSLSVMQHVINRISYKNII